MKTFLGNIAPLPGSGVDKAHPVDIVFHLGRTRRFGGWAHPEWSVLHHSTLVAMLYMRNFGLHGVEHALLHDAHEYVTGDIPTPVKKLLGVEQAAALEKHLDEVVYRSLDIPRESFERCDLWVKACDLAALIIEAYHFGGQVLSPEHIAETGWQSTPDFLRKLVAIVVRNSALEVYEAMLVTPAFNPKHDTNPWGLLR